MFLFKGNANFSRERENADGSAWTESVVDAKNKLTIKTGNDTNIIGGQLKGNTVNIDVGNN
ncbi:hemagglutinin repeat-containing protein [Gilliamella apicola]|uniref:hemagglutinin repeat-containing protein n=1 Tax=Gilliamella sp. WF3-4 TaxID=3120255 RepID=UPI0009BD12B1